MEEVTSQDVIVRVATAVRVPRLILTKEGQRRRVQIPLSERGVELVEGVLKEWNGDL
ncbi:hypothetical protein LCGC14_1625500 [marine sediment metagenome]|uniref:Uncharacterized protein n=1 Tax=marine sediment metagenome TaxID=412755 RepID=A0A0F9KJR0_9ZZZZ